MVDDTAAYGFASCSQGRVSPLPKWRMRRLSVFVDAHLDAPLSLGLLAEAVGLSPMHFAAQFRLATGMRPAHYVMQRRVERAKALIGTSGCALQDVARLTGFQGAAHFSTVFKRVTGSTPSRYRASNNPVPALLAVK